MIGIVEQEVKRMYLLANQVPDEVQYKILVSDILKACEHEGIKKEQIAECFRIARVEYSRFATAKEIVKAYRLYIKKQYEPASIKLLPASQCATQDDWQDVISALKRMGLYK